MVKSWNVGISMDFFHPPSHKFQGCIRGSSGHSGEETQEFASYGNCMFERNTWWRSQFHQFPFCVILLALPFFGGVLVLEDGKWFNHRYYIDSISAEGENLVYRSLAMTVKYTILSSKSRVHGNPFQFSLFTMSLRYTHDMVTNKLPASCSF